MKKLFYLGVIGLILFEIAKVYFIMPMPGASQHVNSIDLAYFLHNQRWIFRGLFVLLIVAGLAGAFKTNKKWLPVLMMLLVAAITYGTNFEMAADTMFYQPKTLLLKNGKENKVDKERLVIGVEENGEAKAYPIQYIGYHHQVQDQLNGKPIIVTYCTVCRTGRVFEPVVNNKPELFRLVGMDHFNAMFEDGSTHSWWRQANGEAIAGPLKGQILPELHSIQTSLEEWIKLHPNTLIMQPDPDFQMKYDSMSRYESGKGKSALTKTDSLSWKEKSWVVGIQVGKQSKAFDWNRLKKERVINSEVGGSPMVLVLATDNKSFFAFIRPTKTEAFSIKNDTLFSNNRPYNLLGKSLATESTDALTPINAYQEFWHSWQTFHPNTERY
ncbi:DUF3179 domain-containing (seleno)protein [Dyadobacter sp. LHD-138]|uniref:DUF3179 domain-containing (seleno)protein n=1 Tax=Dyadobacter sp. LHD-138 TaxID=3071413 RepID=UPI0027E05638|nr:DUF3179 domain-containing (seleno)protein [Dyadobacter sp. LHD-138]MDQ6479640.1 DUF3179 domain-containing (seleno)protein [Dyadobacter sp. LHD-138]